MSVVQTAVAVLANKVLSDIYVILFLTGIDIHATPSPLPMRGQRRDSDQRAEQAEPSMVEMINTQENAKFGIDE